jgi:uncharacterized protein
MAGKFEVKVGASGQFTFNLKAGNGEIILTSEQYKEKADALDGIEAVRKQAVDDAHFDRKVAKNGEAFFTLKAANGRMLGKSETYSSTVAMEGGIASVKKNAVDAKVVEIPVK